ncbi:MAG: phospholipase D-like domain-containing protein [Candidatus Aenigmatarchaeota archaeon]
MKKVHILIFVLISSSFAFVSHLTTTSNIIRFGTREENGNVSIFFCSSDNCENILNEFILSSDEFLYCALYKVNLDSFVDAILAQKERGVKIRIIIDDQASIEESSKYNELKAILKENIKTDVSRKSKYNNLMHNKFCVKDKRMVWTGSFNPTKEKSYDDLIIINSSLISRNYLKEFEEMWNNEFGDTKSKKTEFTHIILRNTSFGDVEIRNYFCPEDNCKEHIINEIDRASKSIHFCLFSLTDNDTKTALIRARDRGVIVSGLFDRVQAGSKYSMFKWLKDNLVDVEIFNSPLFLHYKFFIIDNETVVTGSLNPTSSGYLYNDENLVILKNKEIARLFFNEYASLKNNSSSR